jgi:hypothetical protein
MPAVWAPCSALAHHIVQLGDHIDQLTLLLIYFGDVRHSVSFH